MQHEMRSAPAALSQHRASHPIRIAAFTALIAVSIVWARFGRNDAVATSLVITLGAIAVACLLFNLYTRRFSASKSAVTGIRLNLGIAQPIDHTWSALDSPRSRSLVESITKLDQETVTASGVRCTECGVTRHDGVDVEGRPFILFSGVDALSEGWRVGAYVQYTKLTALGERRTRSNSFDSAVPSGPVDGGNANTPR